MTPHKMRGFSGILRGAADARTLLCVGEGLFECGAEDGQEPTASDSENIRVCAGIG